MKKGFESNIFFLVSSENLLLNVFGIFIGLGFLNVLKGYNPLRDEIVLYKLSLLLLINPLLLNLFRDILIH